MATDMTASGSPEEKLRYVVRKEHLALNTFKLNKILANFFGCLSFTDLMAIDSSAS